MRIVKLFIISVVILAIAVTFVFSLFPSHIRINRVITINAGVAKISSIINDAGSWNEWNSIAGDQISAVPGAIDHGIRTVVTAENMRIDILESKEDSIRTVWTPKKGRPFSGGFNLVSTQPGVTVVEWYFEFSFKWYPWEKLGSMFYDKEIGPAMEKSLISLKRYIENR